MMDEQTLNDINGIVTPMFFGLGCIMVATLFYRVRFRMDKSMFFISIVYLSGFFFRLPFLFDIQKGDNPYFSIANLLIFAMLYYFVFEMRKLKDKFESNSL